MKHMPRNNSGFTSRDFDCSLDSFNLSVGTTVSVFNFTSLAVAATATAYTVQVLLQMQHQNPIRWCNNCKFIAFVAVELYNGGASNINN